MISPPTGSFEQPAVPVMRQNVYISKASESGGPEAMAGSRLRLEDEILDSPFEPWGSKRDTASEKEYTEKEKWPVEEHSYSMKGSMGKDFVQIGKCLRIYLKFKRLMDILISALGLILLLPVFIMVALAIKLEEPGGRVIYSQERIGRRGTPFRLFKFRSMRMGTPELSTHEFSDSEQYITGVGKVLRRTSIDELPQLWNVLIGDMSLVGPRPLLPRERNVHRKRFQYGLYQVRPGITGMAQTHGRDAMDDDDKVRWDKRYVENLSAGTDAMLILRTARQVIMCEGVLDREGITKKRDCM